MSGQLIFIQSFLWECSLFWLTTHYFEEKLLNLRKFLNLYFYSNAGCKYILQESGVGSGGIFYVNNTHESIPIKSKVYSKWLITIQKSPEKGRMVRK